MKKLISLTLAILLILSLAVPALAADGDEGTATKGNEKSGSTTATGKIGGDKQESYYEINIPTGIDLKDLTATSYTDELKLSVARLHVGQTVSFAIDTAEGKNPDSKVTLTSDNKANTPIVCTLAISGSALSNTTDKQTLTITPTAADVANAKVGTYTGVVNFTVTPSAVTSST